MKLLEGHEVKDLKQTSKLFVSSVLLTRTKFFLRIYKKFSLKSVNGKLTLETSKAFDVLTELPVGAKQETANKLDPFVFHSKLKS